MSVMLTGSEAASGANIASLLIEPVILEDQVITPRCETSEGKPASREEFIFRGRILAPGTNFHFPEQTFTQNCTGSEIILRNQPDGKWPSVTVNASRESGREDFRVRSLRADRADESVEAWLLLTRFLFGMTKTLFIVDDAGERIQLSPKSGLDNQSLNGLRGRCSIIRKLWYIERVLDQRFRVPEEIPAQEIYMAGVAFRAITEGEFTLRQEEWTFRNVIPVELHPDRPPFTGPGSFSKEWSGSTENRSLQVLGSQLDLGPFTISIEKAEIANPWVLEDLQGREHEPVDIRFVVYDSQVSFRFRDYAGPENRESNCRRLEEFKALLAAEEPEELVALIDRSLQLDVSCEEAIRIAMGWLQYNRFPDRYCAQRPPDEEKDIWRVPINLAYCDGSGGPVGHIIIDRKTGAVVDHTPADQIRTKGAALAEGLLNAR